MTFLRNGSFLTLAGSMIHDKFAAALGNNDSVALGHVLKIMSKLTYFFLKHGVHIKCEITAGKKNSKDFVLALTFLLDRQSAIQTKKWQISWKKNWTPSLRSTEESTVNRNSFSVLSILYITNFCETRKINSNAILILFLLLSFWKNRKCALN